MMDAWLGGRLRSALSSLPRPLRAIVVLREIEGLSTRDVAEITQISEANVKTRLHRARALLRKQLVDL
jgi:RNA polymerase sigma-70 factor (ECF subfamily)